MDTVEKLLEELTNAPGAAGFEDNVRRIMRRELKPFCDSMVTDEMGSLIARMRGPVKAPRVMLAAHMDEVSLIVRYVTPDGLIKFQTMGAWLDHALVNQRWHILTRQGPVSGVSGLKSPHTVDNERNELFSQATNNVFIDVGATSDADAQDRLGILPGDPIVPDSRFAELNGNSFYVAKAFDDRVGLAVIIETMRALAGERLPVALYAVATVQEEVGSRGAHTSVFKAKPDIAINIEAGLAGDHPGFTQDESQERLGAGPTLFMHDSSILPNLKMRHWIVDVAKKEGIPLQFEVTAGYGDDGDAEQQAYAGVPVVNIGIPTRYLHNHNSVLSRDDFDNTVGLLTTLVRRLTTDEVTRIRRFD